jgi:hypothetical protein
MPGTGAEESGEGLWLPTETGRFLGLTRKNSVRAREIFLNIFKSLG